MTAGKIKRLSVSDFKKIEVVEITPQGNVVEIAGKNGNGKTSALDAIQAALGGTSAIPADPVRHGAEKAEIVLETDGGLTVTRVIPKVGTPKLVVETADGMRPKSPQTMLDELVGALSFDPLEFVRMKPKDQVQTLKGFVTALDIDATEAEIKVGFDERTAVNRRVKDLESRVGAAPDFAAAPDHVDLSGLRKQIEEGREHNAKVKMTENTFETLTDTVADLERMLSEAKADLAEITKVRDALEPPVDLSDLERDLDRAIASNEERAAIMARKDRFDDDVADLKAARAKSDALTTEIEDKRKAISDAVAASELPGGISIGEAGVMVEDYPFEQASAAEQLLIATRLGMAFNPGLKIIRIKDGSLLDDDSWTALTKIAEDNDFQIWIEVVGDGHQNAVVIEAGRVRDQ